MKHDCSAIYFAVIQGHVTALNDLISSWKSCSICLSQPRTPLHVAAMCGSARTIRILIQHFEAAAEDSCGQTALHLACKNGYWRAAKELLKYSAEAAGNRDMRRQTPLHLAVTTGKLNLTTLLL